MKKFFGVIFVIAGGLWALIFLISGISSPAGTEGANIIATILFVGIGVCVFWLGLKLIRSKKKVKDDAVTEQGYQPPEKENAPSAAEKPQKTEEKPTLKDIKQMVDGKIALIRDAGYQISASELKENLLSLNGDMIPFSFAKGDGKKADMVGHWKLADTDYLGLLGIQKNKLQSEFNVLMKFDEEKGELRCKDQLKEKSSSFGLMGGGAEFSSFSGRSTSVKKEIVIGRKKDGTIGKVVDISLDTTILQNAIKAVAEKSGWTVKRVAGKL